MSRTTFAPSSSRCMWFVTPVSSDKRSRSRFEEVGGIGDHRAVVCQRSDHGSLMKKNKAMMEAMVASLVKELKKQ